MPAPGAGEVMDRPSIAGTEILVPSHIFSVMIARTLSSGAEETMELGPEVGGGRSDERSGRLLMSATRRAKTPATAGTASGSHHRLPPCRPSPTSSSGMGSPGLQERSEFHRRPVPHPQPPSSDLGVTAVFR